MHSDLTAVSASRPRRRDRDRDGAAEYKRLGGNLARVMRSSSKETAP